VFLWSRYGTGTGSLTWGQKWEPEPRNRNFSKVVTGTVKNSNSSTQQHCLQGAEHLKNLQNETKGSRSPEDFHIELLRLRQNWRLKKVGSTILGDLSYRTAGSQFRQSGMFEVTKADDAADAGAGGSPGAAGGTAPAAGPTKPRSALKVTVPSELEGIAYIQVTIQRDNEQLVSATLGQFSGVPQKGAELHWQNKLEAGQFYLHPLLYWRAERRIVSAFISYFFLCPDPDVLLNSGSRFSLSLLDTYLIRPFLLLNADPDFDS
jgi:hypothetical protein